MLGQARMMADKLEEEVVGVLIGNGIGELSKEVIAFGADQVIVVEGDEYAAYSTDAYTNAFTKLSEKYAPSVILIGATINGRDLGARTAVRLKTGLTADCTHLDVDMDERLIKWTRPAFGGNIMATILCPNTTPQIGTVRSNVFQKPTPDYGKKGMVIKEDIRTPTEGNQNQDTGGYRCGSRRNR